MKIVITDSGLGGLSVCAEIESIASKKNFTGQLDLIYFNSLPDNGYGYNNMKNNEEKAAAFNSALNSIESKFHPDMILIACNTLSVVFNKTRFSQTTKTKVVGIVDFGVEMIVRKYRENPNAMILLLGTPTTINSLTYQNKLIESNIPKEKIVGQSCFLLETKIQENPFSNDVLGLITKYAEEAKEKTVCEYDKIIVLLACTHYGYSLELFNKVLQKVFSLPVILCNPNENMAESVFGFIDENHSVNDITVKLFSRANISASEKEGIGKLIKHEAPKTYDALINPIIDKQLFAFEKHEN
jgi:glutamate racemase